VGGGDTGEGRGDLRIEVCHHRLQGVPRDACTSDGKQPHTRVRVPASASAATPLAKPRGWARHSSLSAQWPISTATGSEHISHVIRLIASVSDDAPCSRPMFRSATISTKPSTINTASNSRLADFAIALYQTSQFANSCRSLVALEPCNRSMHEPCQNGSLKGI